MNQIELLGQAIGGKIGQESLLAVCPSVHYTLCESSIVCIGNTCTSFACVSAFGCSENNCTGFNCPGFTCGTNDTCRMFGITY